MNLLRREICKENTNDFLAFLKVSEENKGNPFCNLDEYRKIKKLYPLNDEMKKLLKEHISKTSTVIDITVDEDNDVEKDFSHENFENSPSIDKTTIEDVTYAIKENLGAEKTLPLNTIQQLHNLENLEGLFVSLSAELNFEEVCVFGKALLSTCILNESIIAFYVKYLLLKKVDKEYTEELGDVFNTLTLKFTEILRDEISTYLLNQDAEYTRIFLQVMDRLNQGFKPKLLGAFILNCSKFQNNHIPLLESLLTNQTDTETFSKLLQVISISSDNFNTNKAFGKLLLSIVKCLGRNIHTVEPLLRHIISSHKSVWKSKIQRCFEDHQQESQFFSQSFR